PALKTGPVSRNRANLEPPRMKPGAALYLIGTCTARVGLIPIAGRGACAIIIRAVVVGGIAGAQFREETSHRQPEMAGEVPADVAAGVGEPVRKFPRPVDQEMARRFNRITGQNQHFTGDLVDGPAAVGVFDSRNM